MIGVAEILEQKPNCFSALVSTITLCKCFRVQLWENSIYLTKQLPGIGLVYSKNLANAGMKTFQDILNTNPRELERVPTPYRNRYYY